MEKQLNILVAPLNWGLGHATRCMPIINELLAKGHRVIIATDGHALALLQKEYPNLQSLQMVGYNVSYGKGNFGFVLSMFWQLPKIFWKIFAEHRQLQQIVDKHKIDVVIADNRYGCFSKKAYSIFMTHQIFVKMPPKMRFLEPTLLRLNKWFINNFEVCWIPDFADKKNSLAGELAHLQVLNAEKYRFIGLLSRFGNKKEKESVSKYDVLFVLSGPEPQRTFFEQKILKQLENFGDSISCLVVRGLTEKQAKKQFLKNVKIINFMTADALNQAMLSAKMVVARSGYSTIMDLAVLGKKAILVPTAQQTEQEYLADYFEAKKVFYTMSAVDFDLKKALQKTDNYSGIKLKKDNLLESRLNELPFC
ncbi:MAG: glycosyltransferase [Chitinophagales bacterium]